MKLGLRGEREGKRKGIGERTSEREEKSKKETSEKFQYDNAAVIEGRIASNSTWNSTQEIRTFDRQTKRHVIVVSSYPITPKPCRTIFDIS